MWDDRVTPGQSQAWGARRLWVAKATCVPELPAFEAWKPSLAHGPADSSPLFQAGSRLRPAWTQPAWPTGPTWQPRALRQTSAPGHRPAAPSALASPLHLRVRAQVPRLPGIKLQPHSPPRGRARLFRCCLPVSREHVARCAVSPQTGAPSPPRPPVPVCLGLGGLPGQGTECWTHNIPLAVSREPSPEACAIGRPHGGPESLPLRPGA